MKSHFFDVHANFKPKNQTLAPGGPTSSEPLDEAQPEPSILSRGAQSASLFPSFEFSKHCNCRSRHVEAFNIPPGHEHTVLSLIQHFGETETEPVYNPLEGTVVANYFDDRSAAKLVQFVSLNSSSLHPRISARKVITTEADSILLNSPWGIAVSPNELEKHMAQHGEIEHFQIESSVNGGITRAQFLYHDRRVAIKVANSNFTCRGSNFLLQLTRYPHSLVCQMKDFQFNASSSSQAPVLTQGIMHPEISTGRTASFTGQSQTFQQAPFSRLHQPCPIGVNPFQGRHTRKTSSSVQKEFQDLDAKPLSLTSYTDHFDVPKLSSHGVSGAGSPSIAFIGPGSCDSHHSSTYSVSSMGHPSVPRSRAFGSFSSIDSTNSLSPARTPDKIDVSEHESCLDVLKRFNTSYHEEDPSERNDQLLHLYPSVPQQKSSHKMPSPAARLQFSAPPKKDATNIDLMAIDAGIEKRTTVMVRNIPNKLEFDDFKRFVDQTNRDTYEFLYLRFDFCNRCNVGYAFISFTKPEHVKLFVQSRTGMKWSQYNYNSEKVIEIRFARIQGCENLIQKFRNSPVMHQESAFRPKLYYASGDLIGKEKPFPAGISQAVS